MYRLVTWPEEPVKRAFDTWTGEKRYWGDRIEERLHTEIAMAQASYPTTGFSLPEGYRSLREAAMMFLKAFPNRDLRQAPPGQPMDGVGSAGQRLAREIPVYGLNTCSQAFEPLLTNTRYVFSEDLMRAEHAVWPTAPGGTYIDLAVKVEEFNAYLRKEIRLDVMRSQRTG